MACFQVAISAPSQRKYTLIIKFYNGVFGLSLNRHLKQTAVVKSVFIRFNLSAFVKCQVILNYLVMIKKILKYLLIELLIVVISVVIYFAFFKSTIN